MEPSVGLNELVVQLTYVRRNARGSRRAGRCLQLPARKLTRLIDYQDGEGRNVQRAYDHDPLPLNHFIGAAQHNI